ARGQRGEHDVVVRAEARGAWAEQALTVKVLEPEGLVSGTIDDTGGVLEVQDTGTTLDGLRVELPPNSVAAGTTVSVARLSGPAPSLWREQTQATDWFTVLPFDGGPTDARVVWPAPADRLPAWASPEDVR